ncbi:isoleucine--tRNA ligase [Nanoarchaeota archaeon]
MKTITNKYDFKEVENEVTNLWEALAPKIKATTQYDKKKKLFSFLEGPPTANAPPGLHHVEVRVFKDVFCRFKHMQGFTVPRKGGWDCHGLPVEVQVEKKLKLESKKDVLKFGEEKFCDECKTDVFRFIKDWEVMTKKLAYWIDLDNPYKTLDNKYIESVWWSLKELYKKELLYEGHKVVPYCPRCETPLSSHEVALGYKDVTETSIFVKFELVDEPGTYFLAWTTTPWTLPGNSALYVHKDFDYVKVKQGDEFYIVAKERVDILEGEFEIVKELKPSDLVGKKYKPLFDYYVGFDDKYYTVDYADFVTIEQGTGLVHSAIMYGEVDFDRAKEQGLKPNHSVNVDGTMKDSVKVAPGVFFKDAEPAIIEDLESRGLLYKPQVVTHPYPHCWRCSAPLLYYALVSWFIAVSKENEKLIKLNQKIQWAPEHVKDGRFGKWLEGAKDWALSRFKFWGTPLPIWRCACGETSCIGSVEEINKLKTDDSEEASLDDDLHKGVVDKIKLKCKCGNFMKRIPHVIDCWYDAGAATFAQYHYPFENKEIFEKSFPYDFIAEAIDQTRGWFYTLHVLGALLFDDLAYKRCYVGGLLCDDKGEKMSKSKGNILVPDKLFEEYGVDAVRLLMCSYPLGENIRFGEKAFKEVVNPFLRILWNSFFYVMSYLKNKQVVKPKEIFIEDAWILSRVNSLILNVEGSLDSGKYSQAVYAIKEFVEEDFSRNYIKLVRNRAKSEDKALGYVFNYVFERVLKLLAPFAPYVSEAMYHRLTKRESVHFDEWPKVEDIDQSLESKMSVVQDVLSAVNYAREKAKLGIRWPVKAVIVEGGKRVLEVEDLKEIIMNQANVKEVKFVETMEGVKEEILLNKGMFMKELKQEAEVVMNEIERLGIKKFYDLAKDRKALKDASMSAKVDPISSLINAHNLTEDFFKVEREIPDSYIDAAHKHGYVYLDKTRNDELDSEGYSRELMRNVQELRKKTGLIVEDRVKVYVQTDKVEMLQKWKEEIMKVVGATELVFAECKEAFTKEAEMKGKLKGKIWLIF